MSDDENRKWMITNITGRNTAVRISVRRQVGRCTRWRPNTITSPSRCRLRPPDLAGADLLPPLEPEPPERPTVGLRGPRPFVVSTGSPPSSGSPSQPWTRRLRSRAACFLVVTPPVYPCAVHPADACRTLAELRTTLPACRICVDACSTPIADVRPGHRALIIGQAPGIHEPQIGLPFAADAGRRLRRWFAPYGLEDEERFRTTFAMTAVMKCYPGRDPGGRGDRRPTPVQLANCAPWTA